MRIRRAGAGVVAVVGAGLFLSAAAPAARAQVKLEYKFPEGQTLTYKTTSKMSQVLTLAGMEFPTDVEQSIVTSQAIGKRAADSSLSIREKVEQFRADMKFPMDITITYDSKEGEPKISNDALAFLGDILKFAAETTYTVVLDGKNKVKAIEGAEKLVEKAEKLDERARDAMKARLSAEKLRSEFDESHGNLPDVLARPGEPWERTTTIHADQEMTFRKRYEYVGTEKKGDRTLDKIAVKTLEMQMKPTDPGSQAPSKIVKSELKVESSDGTILFDREAGRVVESREKIRAKGPLTISVMGQEISGEIDLTIESTRELQPAAK